MSVPTTDRAAITRALRILVAAGWHPISVDQREDDPVKVSSVKKAVELVMEVDEAFVHVQRSDKYGWLFFVLGNSPEEVLCNNTMNLEEALEPFSKLWS